MADITSPTLTEFLLHAKDPFCKQVADTVRKLGLYCSYDGHGIFVRTASLHRHVQTVSPNWLRPLLLYLIQYPRPARHPIERSMYDIMKHELYCPHMASKLYTTVRD